MLNALTDEALKKAGFVWATPRHRVEELILQAGVHDEQRRSGHHLHPPARRRWRCCPAGRAGSDRRRTGTTPTITTRGNP